jgi:hypothetical protein
MRIDLTNIPEKCIIILYYWISLVWSIDSGNTYKKLMRGVRISWPILSVRAFANAKGCRNSIVFYASVDVSIIHCVSGMLLGIGIISLPPFMGLGCSTSSN